MVTYKQGLNQPEPPQFHLYGLRVLFREIPGLELLYNCSTELIGSEILPVR